MIVVMGATGKVGREIVARLLSAGAEVLALGRSRQALAELERAGAETRAGDAADPAYLAGAFRGARAVFTLLPYDPFQPGYRESQERLSRSIVQAIEEAEVERLVFLSSVGAGHEAPTGFISSLHAHERRLRRLDGTHTLVLRAGAFFENFYAALDQIRYQGCLADTLDPELKLPMIATRDIAAVAAVALMARDWEGFVVRELLGQRDLSYAEATAIIGRAIGRPGLAYLQIGDDDLVEGLTAAGFSEESARLQVELNRAINHGIVQAAESRSPANTTPTPFEEFAAQLVGALQHA